MSWPEKYQKPIKAKKKFWSLAVRFLVKLNNHSINNNNLKPFQEHLTISDKFYILRVFKKLYLVSTYASTK